MKKSFEMPLEYIFSISIILIVVVILILILNPGLSTSFSKLKDMTFESSQNQTELIKTKCTSTCSSIDKNKLISEVKNDYCRDYWKVDNVIVHCDDYLDCSVKDGAIVC